MDCPIENTPESCAFSDYISAIQQDLQSQYDLNVAEDIRSYICFDRKTVESLTGITETRQEALFVKQNTIDDIDVMVFFDKDLLYGMRNPNIHATPNPHSNHKYSSKYGSNYSNNYSGNNGNSIDNRTLLTFDNKMVLVEGVSHFIYLIWNAYKGKSIKPVELELQAEVDKFIHQAIYRNEQSCNIKDLKIIRERIFKNFTLLKTLNSAEVTRYNDASNAAAHYCKWLSNNHVMASDNGHLYAELARFYRMNFQQKTQHINSLSRLT